MSVESYGQLSKMAGVDKRSTLGLRRLGRYKHAAFTRSFSDVGTTYRRGALCLERVRRCRRGPVLLWGSPFNSWTTRIADAREERRQNIQYRLLDTRKV